MNVWIHAFYHYGIMNLAKLQPIITIFSSITPKCVLIHYIFNEFAYFYHGETSQPLSEQGPFVTNIELIH